MKGRTKLKSGNKTIINALKQGGKQMEKSTKTRIDKIIISILRSCGHRNVTRAEMRPAGDLICLNRFVRFKNIHPFFLHVFKQPSESVENRRTFLHPYFTQMATTFRCIHIYLLPPGLPHIFSLSQKDFHI